MISKDQPDTRHVKRIELIMLFSDELLQSSAHNLGRTMDVAERDVISDILHDDYERKKRR